VEQLGRTTIERTSQPGSRSYGAPVRVGFVQRLRDERRSSRWSCCARKSTPTASVRAYSSSPFTIEFHSVSDHDFASLDLSDPAQFDPCLPRWRGAVFVHVGLPRGGGSELTAALKGALLKAAAAAEALHPALRGARRRAPDGWCRVTAAANSERRAAANDHDAPYNTLTRSEQDFTPGRQHGPHLPCGLTTYARGHSGISALSSA